MASRGSPSATISAMFKPGKAAMKVSASGLKARSSIIKSAIKSAIKTNKPTKYSKITGVKPMKVPTSVISPGYKTSMGTFLTGEMRKAKKNFKAK